MLSSQLCNLNMVKPVKVVQWTQQEHWEDIVFQGKNIWVGIEGIPLNWWNIHALKAIGAKLGVMEIAKETIDLTFLAYAKLRVSGFNNGFLPSVLEMPRGSDSVFLGIFPLIDKQIPVLNGSCRALGPAFRRAQSLRRTLTETDFQTIGKNSYSVM